MSTDISEAPIVVGVDGSAASLAALFWARREAGAHRAPLVIVHVLDPRHRAASYSPVRTGRDVEAVSADRIRQLIEVSSPLPVEHVVVVGNPSVVLVERSRGARMLVLGQAARHHRRDGEDYRAGAALGPVARACVTRARCPVLVLPEPVPAAPLPRPLEAPRPAPVLGGRALYPDQGRVTVAHG